MHLALIIAALVIWHLLILGLLWLIPLPPRFERYKPWVMGAGVVIAVVLILHHAHLI